MEVYDGMGEGGGPTPLVALKPTSTKTGWPTSCSLTQMAMFSRCSRPERPPTAAEAIAEVSVKSWLKIEESLPSR